MEWNDFALRKNGFLKGLDSILPHSETSLNDMITDTIDRSNSILFKLLELKLNNEAPKDIVNKMKECTDVLAITETEFDKPEPEYVDIFLALSTVNFVFDVIQKKLNGNKEESSH